MAEAEATKTAGAAEAAKPSLVDRGLGPNFASRQVSGFASR